MQAEDIFRVPEEVLRGFCIEVLGKLDVAAEDAAVWTDVMLEASLRGVDSHGILVLPMYAAMLKEGGMKSRAPFEIVADHGPTMVVDGGGGIGPVIANRAMDFALDRAQQFGLSLVAVRNSNHFGMAGFYAAKSLTRDMVGMALTNAGPAIAASGGKSKVIGSNAMAFACPAQGQLPVVFDAAIGASAAAKIFLAAERGERIPTDWMIDRSGEPTDDPRILFAGGVLLPFGKHKGYGLGLLVDILTGVLSGGLFSTAVGQFAQDMSKPLGVCHCFGALNISYFMPIDEFKRRVDEMIANVKKSERVEGVDQIYLPGERGCQTRDDRKRRGIPLHKKLVEELRQLAVNHSVELPF